MHRLPASFIASRSGSFLQRREECVTRERVRRVLIHHLAHRLAPADPRARAGMDRRSARASLCRNYAHAISNMASTSTGGVVARQRRRAHRDAGMASGVAENLDEEIGGAVHDVGMAGEIGRRNFHVARHLHLTRRTRSRSPSSAASDACAIDIERRRAVRRAYSCSRLFTSLPMAPAYSEPVRAHRDLARHEQERT